MSGFDRAQAAYDAAEPDWDEDDESPDWEDDDDESPDWEDDDDEWENEGWTD